MGGFMLALHGSILLLASLWLLKRNHNWGLRTHRRAAASTAPARA
jgi:hypothetical protein